MSPKANASLFAALGDETRLALINKRAKGRPYSIARLTKGSKLTRQAVTKHLRVLESAGVVRSVRDGRENLFELNPKLLVEADAYLRHVSEQWDGALGRLKTFVES